MPSFWDNMRRLLRPSSERGQAPPVVPGHAVDSIRTVCIFLGPYRNLTTLTSALLALHPNCQVLNHAANRILGDPTLDFLARFDPVKLRNFCAFALEEAVQGSRGNQGGSITLSHAFDHEVMRDTYRRRYGESLHKDLVHCVVWKDSLRVSNYLRETARIGELLDCCDSVRFLMPVRHPMDCATSNHLTRKSKHFQNCSGETIQDVLAAVLQELRSFQDHAERRPDRFFSYFQDDFGPDVLRDMAKFLGLEPEAQWIEDATTCYQLKPSYDHDAELRAAYRTLVAANFADRPQIREKLDRAAA